MDSIAEKYKISRKNNLLTERISIGNRSFLFDDRKLQSLGYIKNFKVLNANYHFVSLSKIMLDISLKTENFIDKNYRINIGYINEFGEFVGLSAIDIAAPLYINEIISFNPVVNIDSAFYEKLHKREIKLVMETFGFTDKVYPYFEITEFDGASIRSRIR